MKNKVCNSHQSRVSNSLRNIATSFAGYFLTMVLGYISRIFFVRYLTAEYLGVNGLFSSILSMLSLAELGIGSAIGFALYKPIAENNEDKIASLMHFYKRAYQVIGLTICVAGLLMLPLVDVVIQNPPNIKENIYFLYLVFLFDTVISYFFSYKGTLLVAAQKNYVTALVSYFVTIIQHILQIVVLITTQEYIPYLLIRTAGVVTNNILIAHMAERYFPCIRKKHVAPIDKNEKKTFFINIKALTINKLCTILVNNTDNIVITYLNGLVTTGIASNYTLLSGTLNTLITQVFSSMTASIGNLNAGDNNEKKHDFFKTLSLSTFWLYSWAAIGVMFVASDLVKLCFGSEYVLDAAIPFIIAINMYIAGINNPVYTFKGTMGLFRYGQYLLLFTALINLVLDFWLGRILGLFGIYIATAVARLATNAWFEPYMLYKHGFHKSVWIYFRTYLTYSVVFFLAVGLCYFPCEFCHFGVIGDILAKVVICSVIPNIMYWLCFHNSKEFKHMQALVLQILKKIIFWLPANRK